MKLYPKKLDSLEALKREKIRLKYERQHSKASDLNPLTELGRGKISGTAKSGLLATIIALVTSQSQWETALALGKPLLKVLRNRRAKARKIRYTSGLPRRRSFGKKIVTEIAVNYLIGKAVQMSVRGFQLFLKRKKAKKAALMR